MDTRQSQEPCHHSVKTNTTSAVWRYTNLTERRQVLLDTRALWVDALGTDTFFELAGIIDTLTTGENLLATQEKVKGVGHANTIANGRARVIGFGVEGACSLRELVDDVEVGVVLGTNNGSQGFLLRR